LGDTHENGVCANRTVIPGSPRSIAAMFDMDEHADLDRATQVAGVDGFEGIDGESLSDSWQL